MLSETEPYECFSWLLNDLNVSFLSIRIASAHTIINCGFQFESNRPTYNLMEKY